MTGNTTEFDGLIVERFHAGRGEDEGLWSPSERSSITLYVLGDDSHLQHCGTEVHVTMVSKPDPLVPLPCPICGRVVVIILEFDRKRKRNSPWRVYHKGEGRCFLEGVKIHADTPEGAVAEWNERA